MDALADRVPSLTCREFCLVRAASLVLCQRRLEKSVYVDRLVEGAGGERICLAERPHWFRVARQGTAGIALILAGVALALSAEQIQLFVAAIEPCLPFHLPSCLSSHPLSASDGSGAAPPVSITLSQTQIGLDGVGGALAWGGITLALAGVLALAWVLLDRHLTDYAIVTPRVSPGYGGRIIKVQGIVSRQTVIVPLLMVNDLVVHEPLLGRVLGWGHIDIETGNDYAGDRLEFVPHPRGFQEIWRSLFEKGYEGYVSYGHEGYRGHERS